MTKTLEIYISENFGNYQIVDSLVLDIDDKYENLVQYYAENLTRYFKRYYEIKNREIETPYIITSEELKIIINSDIYYLGSYKDVSLYPNRVKFVIRETRIKYFTDICK